METTKECEKVEDCRCLGVRSDAIKTLFPSKLIKCLSTQTSSVLIGATQTRVG